MPYVWPGDEAVTLCRSLLDWRPLLDWLAIFSRDSVTAGVQSFRGERDLFLRRAESSGSVRACRILADSPKPFALNIERPTQRPQALRVGSFVGGWMRLPWLQVNADGITRARAFGRLLGIGEDAGVGVVLRMWQWALELAPDGDFSGRVTDPLGLAAGAGLDPGWSARVVTELQRVGLIQTHPELRVRGLDRYASAWRKNRKSGGRPPVSALVGSGTVTEPKRKTETEIKTETDTSKDLPSHPIQAIWNAHRKPPIPVWSATKGKRKTHADARWNEHPETSFWVVVMGKILKSDFLSGRKMDFKASPDWVMNPTNLTKIVEGNYDSHGAFGKGPIDPSTAAPLSTPLPQHSSGCACSLCGVTT